MKEKLKTQNGITLIALIITIIVMLILVAVTINMAINGGLFSYAGRATSETKIEEVKEKITLLLYEKKMAEITGEIIDYRSEIKEQYPNYSVYYDANTWIKVYTDNGILNINQNFNIEDDNTTCIYKENVAALKASQELKEGDIVYSLGYYTKADNGEAKYIIASDENLIGDNGRIIELDNGLKAVLQIENDTVTVEQFGAYGNRKIDDYQYFQQAIDSGAKTICLGNKEFLIDQRVVINKDDVKLISYRENYMFRNR